jgi:hypothetical protein
MTRFNLTPNDLLAARQRLLGADREAGRQGDQSDDLLAAHQNLMAAYRNALRQGDQLDVVNRAFVHHVIRVSSDNVVNALTHVDNSHSIASDTKSFTEELAKKDSLGYVLSIAQAQKAAIWTVFKFVFVTAILGGGAIGVLNAIRQAGNTVGHSNRVLAYQMPKLIFLALGSGFVKRFWDEITSLYQGESAAQRVLATGVDRAETRFFQLAGGRPPHRIAINTIGPVLATILVIAGAAVVWLLFSIVEGAMM